MYELFEHTADVGLRVTAADLDQLFVEAARGLFSMIVEDAEQVQTTCRVPIVIEGDEPTYLLLDWLTELLATFDTRHLLLAEFDVEVTDRGIEATAAGEPVDPQRHRLLHEIKAITYHGLSVERTNRGWQAEVIVDI
ncbi:MAG: archease [Planctomycetota bacterium]